MVGDLDVIQVDSRTCQLALDMAFDSALLVAILLQGSQQGGGGRRHFRRQLPRAENSVQLGGRLLEALPQELAGDAVP